jgi:hypothetical protein
MRFVCGRAVRTRGHGAAMSVELPIVFGAFAHPTQQSKSYESVRGPNSSYPIQL